MNMLLLFIKTLPKLFASFSPIFSAQFSYTFRPNWPTSRTERIPVYIPWLTVSFSFKSYILPPLYMLCVTYICYHYV